MKNIYLFIIVLLSCFKVNGQSTDTNTSQEPDENVNTKNTTTRINLYNIDLDGQTIPINLVYNHKGVKVNETPSTLGLSWQIENIGLIVKTINDFPDQSGWFTQPVLDYSPYSFYDSCLSSCPSNYNLHTPSGDLSPDFFSCKTSMGFNFDFLYKKNYPNSPIPVLLSNDDGFKINTNFSNFISGCTPNSNIVFNILDSKGNEYDFINGPVLADVHRTSGANCRNNYYLQTIKNSNNTDVVTIEYNTATLQRTRYYRVGYNGQGSGNYDYDNDVVNNLAMDYYYADESRLNLKKIISAKAIVDFVYLSDGYLTEINVTDSHGKYITGYKFEYDQIAQDLLLWQVKKFSVDKVKSDIIYQFEYYNDQNAQSYFGHNDSQYEDYFGYCNGVYKDNLFPFAVRLPSTVVKPAGNYFPDLNFAKQFSLSKITNKYGGITEYDYKLNFETHSHFGDTYGGGLLIQSKKEIPLTGTGKITWYDHHDLTGYILLTNSLGYHYTDNFNNKKFYSQIPELDFVNTSFGSEPNVNSSQRQGNFYKTIIETTWDLANTSNGFVTIRDYVPDYTGLYLTPNLKKETFLDEHGQDYKIVDYNYTYQTLEDISRATFHTEVRTRTGGISWFNIKSSSSIFVNRVKLQSKKETMLNPDPFETTWSFTYINDNSSILRSKQQTESNGADNETKYFYSSDLLTGEPNITDLISENIIGVPLLIQSYKGTEKLFENKTAYAKDITTNNLLLPKYKYSKKGTDSPTNLFQKELTYDLYDAKGHLLQYTTENGVPTSIIWGYGNTIPIAKLKNLTYSSISSTIINSLHSKSDDDDDTCRLTTCKEEILRTALNSLRTDFPFAMISSWTYDPLIGKTSNADYKGDVFYYEYEEYNKVKNIKDKNLNILSEVESHFFTQN